MDFNKKGNSDFFNKKLLFKVLGVIFLIAVCVLFAADIKMYKKKQELTSQINSYKKQIEDIKKNNQTIKTEIANSDNPDYLEKIAYEQLNEQKPGEKEIIFISPQQKDKTVASVKNSWDIKPWTGWLSGAWQWIKSKF